MQYLSIACLIVMLGKPAIRRDAVLSQQIEADKDSQAVRVHQSLDKLLLLLKNSRLLLTVVIII